MLQLTSNRFRAAGSVVACILAAAALVSCGGGGGNASPSPELPSETVEADVEVDASVAAALGAWSAKVLTPVGQGAPSEKARLPKSTPTGQSLVVLIGSDDAILLLATPDTGASKVSLSPESTAATFARLLIGEAKDIEDVKALDRGIREASAFPALAAAIREALNNKREPITSSSVLDRLTDVVNDVAHRRTTISADASRKQAQAAVNPVDPGGLPLPLIKNYLGTLYKGLLLSSASSSQATLHNDMTIPWAVSIETDSGKIAYADRVIAAGETMSFTLIGISAGYNISTQQTGATQSALAAQLAKNFAQILLGFVDDKTCIGTLVVAVEEAALSGPPTSVWSILSYIASADGVAKACAGGTTTILIELIDHFVSSLRPISRGWDAATFVGTIVTAERYWNETGIIGVCVNPEGAMIKCPTKIQFDPPRITLAPNATFAPKATLLDSSGMTSEISPGSVVFSSANDHVASVDPSSGFVSAQTASPSPVTVTARRDWSNALGTFEVTVSTPTVTPLESTLVRGGGNEVTLKIAGNDGEEIILPEGKVAWSVMVGPQLTLVDQQDSETLHSSRWSAPMTATPGWARVSAADMSGRVIAQANIEVVDDCLPPATSGGTRLPSVCFRKSVTLTPGVARPITDFVVIDKGNDPFVTSMYVAVGFFKDEPSQLIVLGAASGEPGMTYYYGRELQPIYTFGWGDDIYYSCQGLPNPHSDGFNNLSLEVPADFTESSVTVPVFVVQYQRKFQAASCESGGYLPFERVNIEDCPSGRTGKCIPFTIAVQPAMK